MSAEVFNFKFQSKVLGLLIVNGDFLAKYGAMIDPHYFADPIHQQLCDIVSKYFTEFNASPTFEVLIEEIERESDEDKRAGLAESLEEILNADISDSGYYEARIVEFCKKQAMLAALKDAAGKLKEGELESVAPTIEKALQVGELLDEKALGFEYWKDFSREDIQKIVPKIPTLMGESGSGGIDDLLGGGLERSNFGIVMMPTGRGKTVFLINLAGNAALAGYNVVFISLELQERTLAKRFNVFFSGIPNEQLREKTGEDLKKAVIGPYQKMKKGNLLIKTFPMRSATVRNVESFIKGFTSKKGWKPDLVLVDYLEILKPPYKNKEKHEQESDISEELKGLAMRFDVALWTASQVNRTGAMRQVIRNEDSSGSYAKIFPADVVFTAAPRQDEETDERMVELFNSKNRQGRDQITLNFELDLDRMRYNYRDSKGTKNAQAMFQKFKKARGR